MSDSYHQISMPASTNSGRVHEEPSNANNSSSGLDLSSNNHYAGVSLTSAHHHHSLAQEVHIHLQAGSGSPHTPCANSQRREIGDLAVWTLSSAKHGNGVEQLRDDQVTTFWQSDGQQPHLVNIQFFKKLRVQEIAIFLDFKTDESYTPQKISIRAANSFHELQEIKQVDFDEPIGWFVFPLSDRGKNYIKTMQIQIGILQNQHSGRDTHIRQIKVFAPRESAFVSDQQPAFQTTAFTQFATIR